MDFIDARFQSETFFKHAQEKSEQRLINDSVDASRRSDWKLASKKMNAAQMVHPWLHNKSCQQVLDFLV